MAPIPVKYIVSFSSQDVHHSVDNLLSDDASRRWLSAPDDRSGSLEAELQLEHSCVISHLDIGTWMTYTVCIRVGRSSWPRSRSYVPLLPATTFMSQLDCRRGNNKSVIKMFKPGDLAAAARDESWDRLIITLSQPFRRSDQIGLSLLRITGDICHSTHTPAANMISFTPDIKSLLPTVSSSSSSIEKSPASSSSSPSSWKDIRTPEQIQQHFFASKLNKTERPSKLEQQLKKLSAGGSGNLSRTGQMVLKANASKAKYKDIGQGDSGINLKKKGQLEKRNFTSANNVLKINSITQAESGPKSNDNSALESKPVNKTSGPSECRPKNTKSSVVQASLQQSKKSEKGKHSMEQCGESSVSKDQSLASWRHHFPQAATPHHQAVATPNALDLTQEENSWLSKEYGMKKHCSTKTASTARQEDLKTEPKVDMWQAGDRVKRFESELKEPPPWKKQPVIVGNSSLNPPRPLADRGNVSVVKSETHKETVHSKKHTAELSSNGPSPRQHKRKPIPFAVETDEYLQSLDVNALDVQKHTFAELRHGMEKKKQRKLSKDERRLFFQKAKNFFEKHAASQEDNNDRHTESSDCGKPPPDLHCSNPPSKLSSSSALPANRASTTSSNHNASSNPRDSPGNTSAKDLTNCTGSSQTSKDLPNIDKNSSAKASSSSASETAHSKVSPASTKNSRSEKMNSLAIIEDDDLCLYLDTCFTSAELGRLEEIDSDGIDSPPLLTLKQLATKRSEKRKSSIGGEGMEKKKRKSSIGGEGMEKKKRKSSIGGERMEKKKRKSSIEGEKANIKRRKLHYDESCPQQSPASSTTSTIASRAPSIGNETNASKQLVDKSEGFANNSSIKGIETDTNEQNMGVVYSEKQKCETPASIKATAANVPQQSVSAMRQQPGTPPRAEACYNQLKEQSKQSTSSKPSIKGSLPTIQPTYRSATGSSMGSMSVSRTALGSAVEPRTLSASKNEEADNPTPQKCPLCFDEFPMDQIEQHADECLDLQQNYSYGPMVALGSAHLQ